MARRRRSWPATASRWRHDIWSRPSAYLSPDRGLIAGVVVKYTGDRYMDKRNRALADAFTTVDLGIGYRVDRYEVRLDRRNLTDGRDPVAESEVGDAQYYLMPARNIRLSFNVRF